MAEKKKKEPTFEETLKQLEAVVERLEEGNLPLAEALRLFEKGLKASNLCRRGWKRPSSRWRCWWSKAGARFV